MTPFVLAGHGGTLGKDITVDRTLLATRSIEFDAVLLVSSIAPAQAQTRPGRTNLTTDPKLILLLEEMHRHCKAVAYLPSGKAALTAAGIDTSSPGFVASNNAAEAINELASLLAQHRVWERFPAQA